MFSSRYALISGVASPALPVLYALGRANGYEKCAAPEGACICKMKVDTHTFVSVYFHFTDAIDFCFLSACVSDIYFSGVQVYPQRENGDFTSAFWYREKSPFG